MRKGRMKRYTLVENLRENLYHQLIPCHSLTQRLPQTLI